MNGSVCVSPAGSVVGIMQLSVFSVAGVSVGRLHFVSGWLWNSIFCSVTSLGSVLTSAICSSPSLCRYTSWHSKNGPRSQVVGVSLLGAKTSNL